eukprot:scaffold1272_cov250-Pinguiococcus_pyrenoidosus.AAC.27
MAPEKSRALKAASPRSLATESIAKRRARQAQRRRADEGSERETRRDLSISSSGVPSLIVRGRIVPHATQQCLHILQTYSTYCMPGFRFHTEMQRFWLPDFGFRISDLGEETRRSEMEIGTDGYL